MHTAPRLRYLVSGAVLAAAAAVVPTATAQTTVPAGEWHAFGRDDANSKYSPLDKPDGCSCRRRAR